MQEIFFEAFFSLARLFLDIRDEFLQEKLVKKIKEFFGVLSESDDVVQYKNNKELQNITNQLLELTEILIHLKLVSLSPALSAQKNLLQLKAEILNLTSSKSKKKIEIKASPKNSKDNYSSQRLLDYLKTKPAGAQAAEIARNFAKELSRRTIQRYLNELVSSGLIKKDRRTGSFPKYFLI